MFVWFGHSLGVERSPTFYVSLQLGPLEESFQNRKSTETDRIKVRSQLFLTSKNPNVELEYVMNLSRLDCRIAPFLLLLALFGDK